MVVVRGPNRHRCSSNSSLRVVVFHAVVAGDTYQIRVAVVWIGIVVVVVAVAISSSSSSTIAMVERDALGDGKGSPGVYDISL